MRRFQSCGSNFHNTAAKVGRLPRVMVLGYLGRCGSGAADFARRVGIPEESIIKWDMAETAKGGPFEEIVAHDIFVNCIYLSQPIPPFLTKAMLDRPNRPLSVLVDVSCDTTNPHNPLPVYSDATTFDEPILRVQAGYVQTLASQLVGHNSIFSGLPTLLMLWLLTTSRPSSQEKRASVSAPISFPVFFPSRIARTPVYGLTLKSCTMPRWRR